MSEWLMHTWRQVLDPAVPPLPAPGLMPVLWLVPLLFAAWPWLPGTLSASYWLGLAFQAPSLSVVLLSVLVLYARWAHPFARGVSGPCMGSPLAWVLATLGVLLGWALLFDTLALLPVQLYAWGFSPAAAASVALLALVPWVLLRAAPGSGVLAGVVPVAVALFVLLRLPSGNLWDAVLDPWLWLVLQVVVLRKLSILLLK
jgi:hypothetical protein